MSDIFINFQPRLKAIAYRMLGEAAEAEDMVQETYLRWHRQDPSEIDNPPGWLTTVITRLCIDRLRTLKKQREQYSGPWLPTPLGAASAERPVLESETISYALLVLLENLTPVERAVFILRELFGFDYDVIGEIVERSNGACRQIFSRARKGLGQDQGRFQPAVEYHEALFYRFIDTCQTGNFEDLVSLLTNDITVWSDGGGKVSAATRPITGDKNAARFILGLMRLAPADVEIDMKPLNGRIGLVARQNNEPILALLIETAAEKIAGIFFVRNPDKLRWV